MIKVKLFVYYDERYPTSWVANNVAKQIVEFLEKRGFEVIDANDLKKVLTEYASKPHKEEAVIIFSRDVVPDLILDNPTNPTANSLLRRYLNAGHSIIWLGDIPLFYIGYSDGRKQNLPPNICQNVLGLNPTHDVSYKVRLTFYGLMYNLQEWIGRRPHTGVAVSIDLTPLAINWHGNQKIYHGFIASYARSSFSGFIRIYDFVMDKTLTPEYLEALYTIAVIRNPIAYLFEEVRKLNERLETKFDTIKKEVDSLVEYLKKIYEQVESKHQH